MPELQHRIIDNESMIVLIFHILLIATVFIAISRETSKIEDRIVFITFVLLKIGCGILIGYLYWSYYGGTGDTVYFYEQAQRLVYYYQVGRISFTEWVGVAPLSLSVAEFSAQVEPRTFFFVRLMSGLYAVTQGNYWLISTYLSFAAGIAAFAFVQELIKLSKRNKFIFYIAFLFIPSVTFWSSGLLKESVMAIALYVLGFFVLKWYSKPKHWLFLVLIVVNVLVLWKIKYYIPITLIPLLVLTFLFYQSPAFLKGINFSRKLILYFLLLITGGLAVAFIHPVFHSGRFFELIRISYDAIAQNSGMGAIAFQNADTDFLFFLKNLPLAWFTGWFRPFVWETSNGLAFIWALEKILFTVLAISSILLSFRLKFSQAEKWWGIAILIYTSVLSAVITLSTPNFGTLIRYEVAYIPFLWLLVLYVLNKYKQTLK